MKIRQKYDKRWAAICVAAIALLISTVVVSGVCAQDENEAAQTRNRQEVRNTDQDPKGDALQERIRERIENEAGLQEQDRERLRQHLGECEQLGLSDDVVNTLFNDSEVLKKQIRTQERVLAMAREGLPLEPVTQKINEGLRKGVNEEARLRVCDKMGDHLRSANRFMKQAQDAGIKPGDGDAEQKHTREMTQQMWRGLKTDEMDQLQEQARKRLRNGSCTTEDLTAATETATRLKEMGIDDHRAVRLAGYALQNGYTPREMRQLSWMVKTAHMHGGPNDEVIDVIEGGVRNQHQLSQMVQQMWQHGWMGPADEHGGRSPMGNAGGGGPGDQQGGKKKQGGGQGHGGNGQ